MHRLQAKQKAEFFIVYITGSLVLMPTNSLWQQWVDSMEIMKCDTLSGMCFIVQYVLS